jgi:glucokinase
MPTGRWILALDVGGTGMTAGIFHEDDQDPLLTRRAPTPTASGPEGVVEAAAALVAEVRKEAVEREGVDPRRIAGLGAGLPGALDPVTGVVYLAPNLQWRDVPVRDLLVEATRLTVVVENDANCAALGEWWAGAGRGSQLLVALTLGTGIGGGILTAGRVLRGASGAAGEIGHLSIDYDGRPCACGNRGCLEAYGSGPSIAARAREALEAGAESSLLDQVDGDPAGVTAPMVAAAAVKGDPFAAELMDETGRLLGAGVASLANILNPDRVVVTGGVIRAGDLLIRPMRREVRRRAFSISAEACVIVAASEPELAGLRGAAVAFRREALEGR